ncbi:hypothetical protein PN836_001850 [Ningiella sp. W23]|uniref:hypothetical protein n=1 Tax=Ningiella sp. W23 TaxID=3023715 RepID=UPI003756A1A7
MPNAAKRASKKALAESDKHLLTLVLDERMDVAMSDKPIFGASVTISEKLEQHCGQLLKAGTVVAWLNYIDLKKFACLSADHHYQDAGNYFLVSSNRLMVNKPIILVSMERDINTSKRLLSFLRVASNVHSIR